MGSSPDLQELVVVEGSKMLTDGSLDVSGARIAQNYDTVLGPEKCQTHLGRALPTHKVFRLSLFSALQLPSAFLNRAPIDVDMR